MDSLVTGGPPGLQLTLVLQEPTIESLRPFMEDSKDSVKEAVVPSLVALMQKGSDEIKVEAAFEIAAFARRSSHRWAAVARIPDAIPSLLALVCQMDHWQSRTGKVIAALMSLAQTEEGRAAIPHAPHSIRMLSVCLGDGRWAHEAAVTLDELSKRDENKATLARHPLVIPALLQLAYYDGKRYHRRWALAALANVAECCGGQMTAVHSTCKTLRAVVRALAGKLDSETILVEASQMQFRLQESCGARREGFRPMRRDPECLPLLAEVLQTGGEAERRIAARAMSYNGWDAAASGPSRKRPRLA